MAEAEKSEKKGGPELFLLRRQMPNFQSHRMCLAYLLFVPLSMDPSVGRAGMGAKARVVIATVVRFLSRLLSLEVT